MTPFPHQLTPFHGVFLFSHGRLPEFRVSQGGAPSSEWKPGLRLVKVQGDSQPMSDGVAADCPYDWTMSLSPRLKWHHAYDINHVIFLVPCPRIVFGGAASHDTNRAVQPSHFACHPEDMVELLNISQTSLEKHYTCYQPALAAAVLAKQLIRRASFNQFSRTICVPLQDLTSELRLQLGFVEFDGKIVPCLPHAEDFFLRLYQSPEALKAACREYSVACHDGNGAFFVNRVVVEDPQKAGRLNPILGFLPSGGVFLTGDNGHMLTNENFFCYDNLESCENESLPGIEVFRVDNKKLFGITLNTLRRLFDFPKATRVSTRDGTSWVLQNDDAGLVSVRKAAGSYDLTGLQSFYVRTKAGALPGKFLFSHDVAAQPGKRAVVEKKRLAAWRTKHTGMPASFLKNTDEEIEAHFDAVTPPNVPLTSIMRSISPVFNDISGCLVHEMVEEKAFPHLFSKSVITGGVWVRPFTLEEISTEPGFYDFIRRHCGAGFPVLMAVATNDSLRDRLLTEAIVSR